MAKRRSFFQVFGSLRLAVFLLFIFGLASGAATIIESRYGTPASRGLVYDAVWFELLIGLIVFCMICMLPAKLRRWRHNYPFLLVHLAMILILISAGLTRFLGYEGRMAIREGTSSSEMLSSKDYLQLKGGGHEAQAAVLLYRPGRGGPSAKMKLGDDRYRVAVEEYFPHFSEELVQVEDGIPAIRYISGFKNGGGTRVLMAGDSQEESNLKIDFLAGEFAEECVDITPRGELVIDHRGEQYRLQVTGEEGDGMEIEGLTITVTEFHPDYAGRHPDDRDDPMKNPMLRVVVKDTSGRESEQVLFAFFPDYTSMHGRDDEAFEALEMTYLFAPLLELSWEGGELLGRTNLQVTRATRESPEEGTELPPGKNFVLVVNEFYSVGGVTLAPTRIFAKAAFRAVSVTDSRRPAAARISITGPGGERVESIVTRNQWQKRLQVGDRTLSLTWGPRQIKLPYGIFLEDFILHTYPGSQNPSGYESMVRIEDPNSDRDGESVRIYMNHPLTYHGFKHFQSSYDPDHRGTILSVSYDPGKWPTYVGYMILTLGFFLMMFRGRSAKKSRIAQEVA